MPSPGMTGCAAMPRIASSCSGSRCHKALGRMDSPSASGSHHMPLLQPSRHPMTSSSCGAASWREPATDSTRLTSYCVCTVVCAAAASRRISSPARQATTFAAAAAKMKAEWTTASSRMFAGSSYTAPGSSRAATAW
ncbi:MAG: hypothetical protein QOF29_576 [bacterium]